MLGSGYTDVEVYREVAHLSRVRSFSAKEVGKQNDEGNYVINSVNYTLRQLHSVYPWSFATKEVRLAKVEERPIHHYSFYYAFPTDSLSVWDLNTTEFTRTFDSFYAGSVYHQYFELDNDSKIAAFQNGMIAANANELVCLYTSTELATIENSPQVFIDTLIEESVQRVLRKRGVSSDDLRVQQSLLSIKKKENRKGLARQNPEHRKNHYNSIKNRLRR